MYINCDAAATRDPLPVGYLDFPICASARSAVAEDQHQSAGRMFLVAAIQQ